MSVPGGMKLSTGVMVLSTDEESFTLMTPQGHVVADWIAPGGAKEGSISAAVRSTGHRLTAPPRRALARR